MCHSTWVKTCFASPQGSMPQHFPAEDTHSFPRLRLVQCAVEVRKLPQAREQALPFPLAHGVPVRRI